MKIQEFRKKPVTVRAMKWLGEPPNPPNKKDALKTMQALDYFVGLNWGRADAKDILWTHEADGQELVIYNHLEKCWIPCPVGHYIVQGVLGEFYPVEPAAFHKTYEQVNINVGEVLDDQ